MKIKLKAIWNIIFSDHFVLVYANDVGALPSEGMNVTANYHKANDTLLDHVFNQESFIVKEIKQSIREKEIEYQIKEALSK